MSKHKIYLAVDLGAGSGRVLAGEFDGERIELHEMNRFDNTPLQLPSGWHWNITELYQNILNGLKEAAKTYEDAIVSIGIDSWGVDYGLFDGQGKLLGLPYQYRDSRTDGMMELTAKLVPREKIYNATGIQFMFFNTIYQLMAEVENRNPMLDIAEDLLFTPDLLGYWLTGKKVQERSFASTTQLYNPVLGDWDRGLITQLGLPNQLFKGITDAGEPLGELTEDVAKTTGLNGVKVITVGGHDTASAVAAVPSQKKTPAYLSSGTWSLMGLELDAPVISDESFEDAFTNEIGVGNTVRFLKNICGLWLVQESKRHWTEQGNDIAYSAMAPLAAKVPAFQSLIDPDDERFVSAGRMPEKIQDYCRESGQQVPETPGEIIRCIYESLALRYDQVWQSLMKYIDEPAETLHIVGGGCQDAMLNQFAANAIGVTVLAGPVEATGYGNVLAQMLADGTISSIAEGRAMVAQSSPVKTFTPQDTEVWNEVKDRFRKIQASMGTAKDVS